MQLPPLDVRIELPPFPWALRAFYQDARNVPRGAAEVRGSWEEPVFRVEQDPENYLHLIRCLTEANRALRQYLALPSIYELGVRYAYEEDPGEERLSSLWQLIIRGKGDCGDLVAARASEHADLGIRIWDTGPNGMGGRLWHVQVNHPDGSKEDPSVALGMRL